MPRTARTISAGICYHVLNRGNARATVFRDSTDFQTFLKLADRSRARTSLAVHAYCLMPNHFHFVVQPHADDDVARWMHWLTTTYAHHQRRRYSSIGHIWQGRFKAFPVQSDRHLLALMRYVERNALRAGLVSRSEHWQWGSLSQRLTGKSMLQVHTAPVTLPSNWVEIVNETGSAAELEAIRRSVDRGTPYGEEAWSQAVAAQLGLGFTLRPRGRPVKKR